MEGFKSYFTISKITQGLEILIYLFKKNSVVLFKKQKKIFNISTKLLSENESVYHEILIRKLASSRRNKTIAKAQTNLFCACRKNSYFNGK